MNDAALPYDALLVVGFGGPEHRDDVMPFLRQVVAGRDVPDARLAEVAKQYELFDGVSPINAQTRALAEAVHTALDERDIAVPCYVGNRNWHPWLAETVATMAADGVKSALAVATSAFSSYSGCRQYLDNITSALGTEGLGQRLVVAKVPPFWEVSGFLDAVTDLTKATLDRLEPVERKKAQLVFTAHSLPAASAATCEYEDQLRRASTMVADSLGRTATVVFQSRSGPPHLRWLEPDICDHLATRGEGDVVVVVPIGFVSDHMEILFDLDTRAAAVATERGVTMMRVPTVGTHPRFVAGLADSLAARFRGEKVPTIDGVGGRCFPCASDCCPG